MNNISSHFKNTISKRVWILLAVFIIILISTSVFLFSKISKQQPHQTTTTTSLTTVTSSTTITTTTTTTTTTTSTSTTKAPSTTTTTKFNVMNLNNNVVNWSYAYPSSFITKYNGYWNFGDNNLYLTFDCGYDYNNLASSIMDILETKNVKAVFFVTGAFMNSRPDLINRMIAEGHIVGNHSYGHLNQPQNLTSSTDTVIADIKAWENKYFAITGTSPYKHLFRPPAGAISERSMALMNQLGYKSLLWAVAYRDWDPANQPTEAEAWTALRNYTSAGDIILLHGTSQTSTNILSAYIDEYRSKGYEFRLPN